MRARLAHLDHVRHRNPLLQQSSRRPGERYARNRGVTISRECRANDIANAVPNSPCGTASCCTAPSLTTTCSTVSPQFPQFSMGTTGTGQKGQIVELQIRAAERRRGCVLSCVCRGLVASWVHHQLPSLFGPSEATERSFRGPNNRSVQFSAKLQGCFGQRKPRRMSRQSLGAASVRPSSTSPVTAIGQATRSAPSSPKFSSVILCEISE